MMIDEALNQLQQAIKDKEKQSFLGNFLTNAFSVLGFADRYGKGSIPLKTSLLYVKGIKTLRLLFISFWGIGAGLVFLTLALVLVHVSVFLYAPWFAGAKLAFGLLSAAVYVLAAAAVFLRIFAQDQWMRIFHAGRITGKRNKDD